MMQAFFKGAKLPAGKTAIGTNSSQKTTKDKKLRPLPWVEKVKIKNSFFVLNLLFCFCFCF